MCILLDQNLSPKLIQKLADVVPGLESGYDHDLVGASDPLIFDWAREKQFSAIVSADRDLVHLVERRGPPPEVIRIERCDFPAKVIEQLFRRELSPDSRLPAVRSRSVALQTLDNVATEMKTGRWAVSWRGPCMQIGTRSGLFLGSNETLLCRSWELRHNFTACDATYISLAEATGAVL